MSCSSGCSSGSCTAPPTPTGLNVVYQPSSAWNYLTWSASAGATTYQVFWSTSPGVTTSSMSLTPTTTTDYGHSGVSPGSQYCYRVRAENSYGASGLSSERCVTVPGAPPPTPTGLNVVYQPSSAWNYLTWSASAGATTYQVFWSTSPGVTTSSMSLTPTTTTDYGHSGVVSGSQYCYRVRAENSYGVSSLSSERCVTVP